MQLAANLNQALADSYAGRSQLAARADRADVQGIEQPTSLSDCPSADSALSKPSEGHLQPGRAPHQIDSILKVSRLTDLSKLALCMKCLRTCCQMHYDEDYGKILLTSRLWPNKLQVGHPAVPLHTSWWPLMLAFGALMLRRHFLACQC